MTKINVRRKPSTSPQQVKSAQPKTTSPPEEPWLPTYSKEDEMLAGASKNLEEPFFEEDSLKKKKRWVKKLFIILLILILVGSLSGGAYYLIVKKKIFAKNTTSQPSNMGSTTNQQANVNTIPKSTTPDAVVYAYKAADKDPYSLYYRPAIGGDRKEVQKLEKDFVIMNHDVVSQNVVLANENKIYASIDGGKSYKSIYTTSAGGVINSLKLSSEGDRLAVGLVPDFGNNVKGKVFTIDLSGSDKKDLFDADKYAIYLIGWSNTRQQLAYSEGCYACDGGRAAFKLRDLKTKTSKDLIPGTNIKTLGYGQAVSDDLTKLVFVESTYDSAIKTEGPPGYYSAAPYKIKTLDLTTNKSTDYATIGTKNEKNSNGTDKYRTFQVGFINGTNDPYYSEGNNQYILDATKSNIEFTADKPIIGIYYANPKTVISSFGKDTSDFLLTNYSVSDKKSSTVLSGDNNTVILNVTTK